MNGTIQSIAIAVNKVLTATYHACYSDAKEGDAKEGLSGVGRALVRCVHKFATSKFTCRAAAHELDLSCRV